MASALVDLNESGTEYLVSWGDYLTLVVGELANGGLLHLAVRATAGA